MLLPQSTIFILNIQEIRENVKEIGDSFDFPPSFSKLYKFQGETLLAML